METIVQSNYGVILLGGGAVDGSDLALAQRYAQDLICADGGADHALAFGYTPKVILGDMDSCSDAVRAIWGERIHVIAEQDTTDFEKCLIHIDAPFYLAVGFTGRRLDHTLAAMNAVVSHAHRRVVIVAEEDVIFRAPARCNLDVPSGARVSLFPMGPCVGRSSGLTWPIDGLQMAPAARIGTSNAATGPVTLGVEGEMLVMLDKQYLFEALKALAD
jgi:thiamine pyrophosphokinase